MSTRHRFQRSNDKWLFAISPSFYASSNAAPNKLFAFCAVGLRVPFSKICLLLHFHSNKQKVVLNSRLKEGMCQSRLWIIKMCRAHRTCAAQTTLAGCEDEDVSLLLSPKSGCFPPPPGCRLKIRLRRRSDAEIVAPRPPTSLLAKKPTGGGRMARRPTAAA